MHDISSLVDRMRTLLALPMLLLFLAISLSSMSRKSPVTDEPIHLTAGYSYLVTRDFRLNPEHPPLVKMLAAVPLLLLKVDFPEADPAWTSNDPRRISRMFVFENSVPAEKIIFWGRFPIVLLGTALGGFAFWWSWKIAGTLAAFLTLTLYVFDPNIIAHSQLVTTDLGLAFASTLAVYFLVRYLAIATRRNLWLAAAAFAAAMLTKFTAVALLPTYALACLTRWLRDGVTRAWSRWWRLTAAMALMTVLSAFVVYGFELRAIRGRPPIEVTQWLETHASAPTQVRRWILSMTASVPIPAPSFWKGLLRVAGHIELGHPGPSYLMGQRYVGRRLEYFPVAFAVKTPVGTLILLAVALLVFAYRLLLRRTRRFVSLDERVILLSAGVIFSVAMVGTVNIGLRHILSLYPLIFVFIASQLAWLTSYTGRIKPLMTVGFAALVVLVAVSSLQVYPHYLTYFNEFVGGPQNGWKYLADSNLDYGQDLRGLKAYLTEHKIDEVYLSYAGTAPPEYYGIRYKPLPRNREVAVGGAPRGVVAVSVSMLLLGLPEDIWLWAHKPTATIGHSIWIFDLRGETH